MKVLSIVIPAFNEESTIQKILDKIKNVELPQDWGKEIVIINDNSNDKTEELILSYMKQNAEMIISVSYTHLTLPTTD